MLYVDYILLYSMCHVLIPTLIHLITVFRTETRDIRRMKNVKNTTNNMNIRLQREDLELPQEYYFNINYNTNELQMFIK